MDQLKDKGFVIMMFVILFGGIGYAYWHFVIDQNYTLVYYADCDPSAEVCYVWECDPEALDEEDACTGDPEEDVWYYKRLERVAKNTPECRADDENCDAFACEIGEDGCGEIVCDEETAEVEGAVCSDPDTYNAEHPEELEEEGDEESMMEEDDEASSEGDEEDLEVLEDDDVVEGEIIEDGEEMEDAVITDDSTTDA